MDGFSTRYLYAPPLQCRQSRIFRPALAQTVSLGPDIEGAHSTLKGRADFAGACRRFLKLILSRVGRAESLPSLFCTLPAMSDMVMPAMLPMYIMPRWNGVSRACDAPVAARPRAARRATMAPRWMPGAPGLREACLSQNSYRPRSHPPRSGRLCKQAFEL